ncbi:MAG: DUF1127 domain-containing protein [Myxococcales bacterium]|nr:DUF1127 domain-containing protein [Myxococcales bacterium]
MLHLNLIKSKDPPMADATVSLSALSAPRKPGLLSRLMRRLIAARLERGTYEALSRLSDRELADIGLARHLIADVARGEAEAWLASR